MKYMIYNYLLFPIKVPIVFILLLFSPLIVTIDYLATPDLRYDWYGAWNSKFFSYIIQILAILKRGRNE